MMTNTPTFNEYLAYSIIKANGIDPNDICFRGSDLPPIEVGKVRVYHRTTLGAYHSIRRFGLLPGNMTGSGEWLPFILGVAENTGGKFGGGGLYVVIDLEPSQLHYVNHSWVEFNAVPPSKITAFLAENLSTNLDETVKAYQAYKLEFQFVDDGK